MSRWVSTAGYLPLMFRVPLYDKIISARSAQDGQELLLNEFQHSQESKDGVYAVLAGAEYGLESNALVRPEIVYQVFTLAL